VKPNINFHGIASIRFERVEIFERSGNGIPFANRDIIIKDRLGGEFRIGLFADKVEQLSPVIDIRDPEIQRAEDAKP
jgi:hypothetical protein